MSATVYIGAVGGEDEIGECRDSIEAIARRPGDGLTVYIRGTKGYTSRQMHINNFIESKHDAMLLLDTDMKFDPGTLERLRSHNLPFVSGFYMRRSIEHAGPVWFKPAPAGVFPFEPMTFPPEAGKLTPIGASGWGCAFVHRDVILAVRKLLHGEPEIIEDDMDVYPYDLPAVLGAIAGLRELIEQKPGIATLLPALAVHTATLRQNIRPLTMQKKTIYGSDIRFPFFAKLAGYQMMGDPEVCPGHMVNYPLSIRELRGVPIEVLKENETEQHKNAVYLRRESKEALKRVGVR